MKIYTAQIDNECMSILPSDFRITLDVMSKINFEPLAPRWRSLSFHFETLNGAAKRPALSLIYGSLALRDFLKEMIFPENISDLEFLPICVANENWFLVNCLRLTANYDHTKSIVHRRPSDSIIFQIQHIILEDPLLSELEMFCISDSNRSTLLVVPAFVERIKATNARGLNFTEIGRLVR